jgi:signal transduction histidine kinase
MIDKVLDRLTDLLYWFLGPVVSLSHRFLDRMPRPLDPFRSIKLKLSVLLGISGATGLGFFWIGIGWVAWGTAITAATVGVVILQVLAHGMTKPLREMTAAARAMARGDYGLRVRATSRDEVGELARAFNLMAADLAAADQQRRDLIANVSHELRTPITALHGVLENVADGISAADPATLQVALAQTERLGKLVTELLELSKVDAGAISLNYANVDVDDFLAKATDAARLSYPDTRFVSYVENDLTVSADPARLHQVFANLLENAARHNRPGQPVTVSAKRVSNVTVFDVTDSGTGIPSHQRDRVFERFTRGNNAGGADGGTGLGLAIARWAVGLHHGTIAIVDVPDGTGCRVRVTLPEPSHGGLPDDQHRSRQGAGARA